MCCRINFRQKNKGATLVEFVIISLFVVIPLALLLPLLSKYVESRQYVEQSARYSAWERTAYYQVSSNKNDPIKSDLQIKHEIYNRIFSSADTKIYSQQANDKINEDLSAFLYHQNLDSGKREQVFTAQGKRNQHASFITHSTSEHGLAGFGGVNNALATVLNLAPGFELNTKGLYQSNVQIAMKPYQWFPELGKSPVLMKSTNALLAEGWTIGGPEQVKEDLKWLVPLGATLDSVGFDEIAKIFSVVPLGKELAWMELAKIEPDAVPCERLAQMGSDGRVKTPKSCKNRLRLRVRELGHRI